MIRSIIRLLILFSMLWSVSAGLAAQPDIGQVMLISEYQSIIPGQEFDIAVRLTLPDKWHFYAQDPGASGYGPDIKWQLPEVISIKHEVWPEPEPFGKPPFDGIRCLRD